MLAVAHHPWPLERAQLEQFNDQLVEAVGYPPPNGRLIVHHWPGVEVRIGLPRLVDG